MGKIQSRRRYVYSNCCCFVIRPQFEINWIYLKKAFDPNLTDDKNVVSSRDFQRLLFSFKMSNQNRANQWAEMNRSYFCHLFKFPFFECALFLFDPFWPICHESLSFFCLNVFVWIVFTYVYIKNWNEKFLSEVVNKHQFGPN